jgi:hypothetical protein
MAAQMRFDSVIIVDWSAATSPSPARPSADSIWVCRADAGGQETRYFRTRLQAEEWLVAQIQSAQNAGHRLLIGCDFPFGYPAGFAAVLTGQANARAVWHYLARHIRDDGANKNNRFDVANDINTRFENGPFWGHPAGQVFPHLPARKQVDYTALPFAERREIERRIPSAQTVWKLFTVGSVGSQSLMGLPMIARLAALDGVSTWPFEAQIKGVVLSEVYPSLLMRDVAKLMAKGGAHSIKDAVQVQVLATAFHRQPDKVWAEMLRLPHENAKEEGWILGAGFAAQLGAML